MGILVCALVALAAALQLAGVARSWLDSGLGHCSCRLVSGRSRLLGGGGLLAVVDGAVIAAATGVALTLRRAIRHH